MAVYVLAVWSGVPWLWLLGLAAIFVALMGLPKAGNIRRDALVLLWMGLLVASILAGFAWLGLGIIVVPIAIGVAAKRIPVEFVTVFMKHAAPGIVGVVGSLLALLLISEGPPVSLLACLLGPILWIVVLVWMWRNSRALYRQWKQL